jgi:hypothetical protein
MPTWEEQSQGTKAFSLHGLTCRMSAVVVKPREKFSSDEVVELDVVVVCEQRISHACVSYLQLLDSRCR